jgi:hypothetical protein
MEERKPPHHLPDLIAACDQCKADTPSKVLFMPAGFGNACAVCGRLRRGKPYLSKIEFNQQLKPDLPAKGGNHESRIY